MNYSAATKASLPQRAKALHQLAEQSFDLIVVGGGITGAGIALDAASRGLAVALLEKGDFASGTSSKSTKLIHGGLRYLKQLDVALVREVGQERATVHKLAPHLVQPEKMFIPILEGGQMGYWTTNLALLAYDALAGVSGDDRRDMLSKEEAKLTEPMLRQDWVKGGALYAEYRTDDARLTIENLKTAAGYGAVIANYTPATRLLKADGRVIGVRAEPEGGQAFDLRAKLVVNAAGPWVDAIREIDGSLSGKKLFHAKGVHLVVAHDRFPVQQSIYFDLPDGRMCFAIPRGRATYFGTTDTPYHENLNDIRVNAEDVAYLLNGVNRIFPELNLKADEIESSWAGVRPLIFEEGKSASEISRRDEIFESDSGLLSIAGGKLTGYRKMAERIIDVVVDRLGKGGPCRTREIPLAGNGFTTYREVASFTEEIREQLLEHNLPRAAAEYLVHLYGKQASSILSTVPPEGSEELRLAIAELTFGIANEQVVRLEDWAIRRTGRLYFDKPQLDSLLPALSEVFAERLKLSDHERQHQLEQLQKLSVQHADFASVSS